MTQDSPYFDIVPAAPIAPAAGPAAYAEGHASRVERQPDGFRLFHLSGGHQGEERAILIDAADADALAGGRRKLDEVLIARGAS
jgi:hypothetical protein